MESLINALDWLILGHTVAFMVAVTVVGWILALVFGSVADRRTVLKPGQVGMDAEFVEKELETYCQRCVKTPKPQRVTKFFCDDCEIHQLKCLLELASTPAPDAEPAQNVCVDCNGRGRFTGFPHDAPCQTCHGTGIVAEPTQSTETVAESADKTGDKP